MGTGLTLDELNVVRDRLSDEIGRDLADSLVWASRKRGEFDLDMHLRINDGVNDLTPEKRRRVLELLDTLAAGPEQPHPEP